MKPDPQQPDLSHEIEWTPAFHDLDPMDVVWHGNYVKFIGEARDALLARLHYDYPAMRESGYAWPIVDMRLKYVAPATYGQKLKIRCEIVEWENRLKIDYVIRDAATGKKLTTAYTIQLAVSIATREMSFVCPPVLWERLGVSPQEST